VELADPHRRDEPASAHPECVLEKDGSLSKITKELAATLKYPHHVGAGGAETES
jgi:hypothetical protein